MTVETISESMVWEWLNEVPDPEIPVISVVELGVVRALIFLDNNSIEVTITPTYSGCPAMNIFEEDIIKKLKENGFNEVLIKTVLSPAWTTDWIKDDVLLKLEAYGIAPPVKGSADKGLLFSSGPKVVACPKCKSSNTRIVSQFGSTACKALYSCSDCKEPFEYFKCI
jgi:ring-1,2-phenylacetyl-CoA epoxidase subunit PaaD